VCVHCFRANMQACTKNMCIGRSYGEVNMCCRGDNSDATVSQYSLSSAVFSYAGSKQAIGSSASMEHKSMN
jgi:hypothetical protein